MNRRPVCLFYSHHSLGMGHLVRSMALARAISERYHVVLLNGGPLPEGVIPPADVEIVPLPPISPGEDRKLVSKDPRYTTGQAQALRRQIILDMFLATRPEVILLELFPFGRRKFAGELTPMLDLARGMGPDRPRIVSSVRDLLVTGRSNAQQHDDWAATMANRYLDAVIVHADPAFARLEESFRPQVPLAPPVFYSGFVIPEGGENPSRRSRQGWVVTAGGGLVGEPLYRAALLAQAILWPTQRRELTLIGGPFLPETAWQSLQSLPVSIPGVTFRRFVPHLTDILAGAELVVSQCGYNTALDLVRSRAPALVVPFGEGGENEQSVRAHRLAELGILRVLDESELSGARLAEEICRMSNFHPARHAFSMHGGEVTVQILESLTGSREGVAYDVLA